MKTVQEYSAGCVVFKKEKGQFKFLIGLHSGYKKWVLPKGLIEAGESKTQTATRETAEEFGVNVEIIDKSDPIHIINYFYTADFKDKIKSQNQIQNPKSDENTRRVKTYQESGGNKVRVDKTVYFYLAKFQEGDPAKHGWEMSQVKWVNFKEALKLLAFEGEQKVLQEAWEKLKI
jgi:8-oxo-dGTP pyrophosphatase MutT (NUDIX family)